MRMTFLFVKDHVLNCLSITSSLIHINVYMFMYSYMSSHENASIIVWDVLTNIMIKPNAMQPK